ncbi:CHAT domain-containing protein [Rhodocollybia butyracea]|uniref:CHAT domain-containing protein n=1 Tax=Rhodocollybia butyracea TaxID=206335 RepID=A0A9P5TWU7_9AGAR|nr:CHAT domain-containing protein [Rhodocollybia butyracea]
MSSEIENQGVVSVTTRDVVESVEQGPWAEEDPLTEEIYTVLFLEGENPAGWFMSQAQQLKLQGMLWLRPKGDPERSHLLSKLSKLHFTRAGLGPPPMADLEAAIAYEREALALRPPSHPHRHISLGNLAMSLSFRFNVSGDMDNLEEAIKYARETVALRPKTNPCLHIAHSNLAFSLHHQFHQTRNVKDLNDCLENEHAALLLRPRGHAYREISLDNLSRFLYTRFLESGHMEDLNEGIELQRESLDLFPSGHPNRSVALNSLSVSLGTRFHNLKHEADIKEAMEHAKAAMAIHPFGHPEYGAAVGNLTKIMSTRFEVFGQVEDLQEAIKLGRITLNLCPPGHPDHSLALEDLSHSLQLNFLSQGNTDDLQEAIQYQLNALDVLPLGHPERHTAHAHLSQLLLSRFSHLSDINDLYAAIDHGYATLSSCPSDHPSYPSALGNLASLLHARAFEGGRKKEERKNLSHGLLPELNAESRDYSGTMDDLKKAIEYGQASLVLHPAGHPMRPAGLELLTELYISRFYQLGDINDLHEAVKHGQATLDLHPPDSPSRIATVGVLASSLASRFVQLGHVEDLEDALEHARAALTQLSDGVPGHDSALESVAGLLQARFDEFGRIDDLNEAIKLEHAVLDLHPVGHHRRETTLGSYAFSLSSRFTLLGDLEDLDQAIKYQRESLTLRPTGHPNRALSLSNLATALGMRFDKVHETKDLDEAIEFERGALSLRPPGHPHRHYYSLNSLAKLLHKRFENGGKRADLEEALRYCMEAYTTAKQNMDPLLPKISITLADLHKANGNLDFAFTRLNEASETSTSSLLNRFEAAIAWVKLGRGVDHLSTSVAYDKALLLVQRSLFLRATVEMQHSLLSRDDVKFLASEATSWALRKGNLDGALQTFEQGRALFWSKIRRFRQPLADLRAKYPDMAKEFESLSSRLEHLAIAKSSSMVGTRTSDSLNVLGDNTTLLPSSFKQSPTSRSATMVRQNRNSKLQTTNQDQSAAAFDQQIKEQRLLTERWNDMLSKIQSLPDFSSFLGPAPVNELKAAAKCGPVILLNHAELFIDALIILPDGEIFHIPLTDTAPELLGSLSSQMEKIRSRDTASSEPLDLRLKPKSKHPVPNDVLESLTMLRTLWAIVVEPVVKSLLRVGIKENSRIWWCPGGKLSQFPIHAAGPYNVGEKNLHDYFISSYTSTLSSLISARQSQSDGAHKSASVLAIGQSMSLPKVEEELIVMKNIFAEKAEILKNDKADPRAVLAALPNHPWAHFSCHGSRGTPQEPLSSYFELHNAQLSLLKILEMRLPKAELAFLAACHSAAGEPETPDEALSLAVTLQFCGFPRVIGTLWEMTDDDGPPLVKDFYEYILQNGIEDSATALNLAVKSLQHDIEGAHPRRWATFIHIGV